MENEEISVSVFSSLVINMDRGKAPATLSVHITKNFKLCSSILDEASTKYSSAQCAF